MGKDPEDNIQGYSPLGGNATEGAPSSCDASDNLDTGIRDVPLVYDPISGCYVAHQRAIEQEDDEVSLDQALDFQDMQEFLDRAGFAKTITS